MPVKLNEEDVLSRVKNPLIREQYFEFQNKIELTIRFERVTNRVRSRCKYESGSTEFIIKLKDNFIEKDLAHELMHGQVWFIDNYGILECTNPICQLITDYIEDIVIHSQMFNSLKILPFDRAFRRKRRRWARKLFKGESLIDSYYESQGIIVWKLYKALLYVHVWHLNNMIKTYKEFNNFMKSFKKRYRLEEEYKLAENIINIVRNNNHLSNRENYDNALNQISNINYLNITGYKKIKHYVKKEIGYSLV